MHIALVLATVVDRYCLFACSFTNGPHPVKTRQVTEEHPGQWHLTRRTILAALLLTWSLAAAAQTAPTITLTYHGEIEGLQSTASMQFEDLRLMASGTGFFTFGGRPGWLRLDPLDGRMYFGARIVSPTASYYLSNGQVNGTSDWGYVDIVPDVGSTFLGRVDFSSDAGHVYIDQFWLTPNPLMPPQTTYYFQLDTPAPPFRVTDIAFSTQGGAPVIHWDSTPGIKYRLTYKTDLSAPTWNLVGELTATNSTAFLQDNAATGAKQRFYRLERQN
jgi:hypothetical protein